VLIGTKGIAFCYFVNGLSYIAVIAGLLMMRLPPYSRPAKATSSWSGFREVLAYLKNDRKMRTLMLLTAISASSAFPTSR